MPLESYKTTEEASREITLLSDIVNRFGRIIANGRGTIPVSDGPGKTREKTLTIEKLSECMLMVTAYYSFACTVWSKTKASSILSGTRRKKHESTAYIKARNEFAKESGTRQPAQKDAEAKALVDASEVIEESVNWEILLGHVTAVRDSFEKILKTFETVGWMRKQEWESAEHIVER